MSIGLPFMQATQKQQTFQRERERQWERKRTPASQACGFCSWRKSAYNSNNFTQATTHKCINKRMCVCVCMARTLIVWVCVVSLSLALVLSILQKRVACSNNCHPPPQPAPVAAAAAAACCLLLAAAAAVVVVAVVQCWWIVVQSSSPIHRSTLTAAAHCFVAQSPDHSFDSPIYKAGVAGGFHQFYYFVVVSPT